jgi:autotransporter strand-loop-strand O-heptosyltransferase
LHRTFIHLSTPSLGDTIAWLPQVEEYRLTLAPAGAEIDVVVDWHFCDLFISTYPSLNFVGEARKVEYDASFEVGCHEPRDLQKNIISVATEQLGLPCVDISPKIALPPDLKNNFKKPYVCIATQSTSQMKYWNNPTGWNETVNYLKTLGYDVVCIDQNECYGIEGRWNRTPVNSIRKNEFNDGTKKPPIPLSDRVNDLYFCDFFIGLSSGLSWLAWAMDKPVVLIAGAAAENQEFYTPYKVINYDVCHCCAGDPECEPFDRGNWMWCPKQGGTDREFECSRQISFEMVKEQIDRLL